MRKTAIVWLSLLAMLAFWFSGGLRNPNSPSNDKTGTREKTGQPAALEQTQETNKFYFTANEGGSISKT